MKPNQIRNAAAANAVVAFSFAAFSFVMLSAVLLPSPASAYCRGCVVAPEPAVAAERQPVSIPGGDAQAYEPRTPDSPMPVYRESVSTPAREPDAPAQCHTEITRRWDSQTGFQEDTRNVCD